MNSLNEADSWQPSLVTEVVADDAVPLDRHVVRVGQFAGAKQDTLFHQHIQAAVLERFTEPAVP
ncbi:hypothetical protein [Streptomyces paradoxus]|uniref:hypothetical protein n=1 Tax=Streptomyces paradoxus TaxID=66375 RepID=UPI0038259FCA